MEPYRKTVFVWNEPKPVISVPERLHFWSVREATLPLLHDLVEVAMANSLDRHDQKSVAEYGAAAVAKRFLADVDDYFGYQMAWWQFAANEKQELVGFLLPVIYPGEQRSGLEEATLYYIGVLPEHRGHGYGYDLLCQATRTMQQAGVWRIYCDTDIENIPMIKAFQRAGYEPEAGGD